MLALLCGDVVRVLHLLRLEGWKIVAQIRIPQLALQRSKLRKEIFMQFRYLTLILVLMGSIHVSTAKAQSGSDLYVVVEQSAIDKIVNEAQYPITLVDESWPFMGNMSVQFDRLIAGVESEKYREQAKSTDCTAHAKDIACAIAGAYITRDLLISAVEKARAQTLKAGNQWRGPDAKALSDMRSKRIDFKAHLARLKINLLKAPKISIAGLSTSVKDVSLDIDAIGELYWNHLAWNCTKTCNLTPVTFCCEGHFDNVWERVAEVDVNDIKILTDASIELSNKGVLLYGTPRVQRLELDYDILRLIDLASVANVALADRSLLIIDASKVIQLLPNVGSKYNISSLKFSGKGDIRADITIQAIH